MDKKLYKQMKDAGFPFEDMPNAIIIGSKVYFEPTIEQLKSECNKKIKERRENGTLKKGENYVITGEKSMRITLAKLYIKIHKDQKSNL